MIEWDDRLEDLSAKLARLPAVVAALDGSVNFHIPGIPARSNRLYIRANNRVFKDSKTREYQEKVKLIAYTAVPKDWDRHGDFDVNLAITGTKMDIDAPIKTLLDGLNGVVWNDDKQVHHLDVTIIRSGPPSVSVKVRRI